MRVSLSGTLRVYAVPTGHFCLLEWRWDREFKCDRCVALYQADPSLSTLEPVKAA